MQATLLGLGIALIVALVAALVGPHFVDWSQYRSVFESRLTRLVGLPVRVNGPIEARLLPTPSIVLRDVRAGRPGEEAGLEAGETAVELALGPLLRGELRATEFRLVRPTLTLRLGDDGQLQWPGAAPAIEADALSAERVAIEDGRARLSDTASAASLVLEKLWFNGDVRSLAGPVKGEGGFIAAGEGYGFRLAAGRWGEDGVKLKLNVDPADRRMSVEADGTLRIERGAPHFDGSLTVGRPASVVLARGRAVATETWRGSARIKLGPSGGLMDQVEVQYGPDERGVKLTGTAQLKFGNTPRIDGIVSARQIDLDRAFVLPEGTRRVPLAVLRRVADTFDGIATVPIPVRFGFGIDFITLAGAALQTVRGDLASDSGGWNLENFEFRAPGMTQVRTSARIAPAADGATFTGPAVIESNDPKALLGWLEGRTDAVQGQPGALRASGDIAIAAEKIAVERLAAEIDRKAIAGRLAYSWAAAGRPARVEAELSAAELNVDQTIASMRAAFAGTTLDAPGEAALAIDIGAATIAGVEAKNAHAELGFDANGLVLQRVSIADLGGSALDLSGRVDSVLTSPRGTLTLDLDAGRLDGITALLARYAPQAAEAVRPVAARLAPAKLSVLLTVEPAEAGAGNKAELVVSGKAGVARISLTAQATGEVAQPSAASLHLTTRVHADDGAALIALIGLDRAVAVDKRPAVLTLAGSGLPGEFRLDARLDAARLEAAATGTLRFATEAGLTGDLAVRLAAADAVVLRPAPTGPSVPVTLKTRVAIKNGALSFADISGVVAGAGVGGHLDVTLGRPLRLQGRVDTEVLDLVSLAGAGGVRIRGGADGAGWLTEPFAPGAFADVAGQIAFTARRTTFASAAVAQDARGLVRFGNGEVSLEDVEASVAGGRLLGQLMLHAGAEGLAARTRLALTDADAGAIIPGEARPVTGRVRLQAEAEGSGLSPATLLGSLTGAGTVTLENAQIAGLDAKAFDAVIGAVDRGLTIDAAKVRDMMERALQGGRLAVARVDGAFTIAAGQARWGNVIARADGADLSISGVLDLARPAVDARLTLSAVAGAPVVSVGHPEILIALKGPFAAPKRTLDVSAFTGWLTLRAVERQSKRLETLQSERHEGTVGTTPPASGPVPPAASAAPPPPTASRAGPEDSEPQTRAPTPPAPRRAVAPPLEPAPALPPPIEIRPAPEPRSNQSVIQRPSEAHSASGPAKPRATAPARPPAEMPPAAARRSVLDQLFGPQR